MTKLYITTFAFFLLVNLSFGQDTTSITHISDNLGYTKSSRSIYKGTLLTRISFGYSETKAAGPGYNFLKKAVGIPGVNIGFGIFKNIDLRIGIGMSYNETHFSGSDYSGSPINSFTSDYKMNNFAFGSKINLFKQQKLVPELAYSLDVNTLFTSTNSRSHIYNTLAFSYNLGEKFRLGGNFGLRTSLSLTGYSEGSSHLFYSLNIRYEFMDGLGAFMDFKPANISSIDMNSMLGIYYRLNNNMQFNLYGGTLLLTPQNYPSDVYFVSGGFSWLLLRD